MGRVLLLFATLAVCCLTPATAVYAGCCEHMGNVDGSTDGQVTMGDLTVLIDHLFISYAALDCPQEGNFNLCTDNEVTMGDLTVLIDHLFITYTPLPPCPAGDCPPTVTDIDGNVYQTVLIGGQCWMMGNLKVTHYRNGDPIPRVTDGTWPGLTSGAYCEYDNNPANVETYGRLYNWYAIDDSRNIAPEGWHVPSDAEWQTLVDCLEDSSVAGGKLKEVGTTHWFSPNTGATNESGFTALPGGCRNYDGSFNYMGDDAYFWSTTEFGSHNAWSRFLNYWSSQVYHLSGFKRHGFSVRCVRDQLTM